jgi:hypothetical protein
MDKTCAYFVTDSLSYSKSSSKLHTVLTLTTKVDRNICVLPYIIMSVRYVT